MKAPNVTDGDWFAHCFKGDFRIRVKGLTDDIATAGCFDKADNDANAKMLAASKKLAEALNDMVIVATAKNWSSSITGEQIIYQNAQSALLAAGYTEDK